MKSNCNQCKNTTCFAGFTIMSPELNSLFMANYNGVLDVGVEGYLTSLTDGAASGGKQLFEHGGVERIECGTCPAESNANG